MDLQDWKLKGTTFNYKNKAVFNYIEGKGEPIIFIHSDPGAGYEFKYLIPHLKDKHKLIMVDMLGFGFSDKPNKYEYSLNDQAEMLEVLLTLTGSQEYHVVCSDIGSYVALTLLEKNYRARKVGAAKNSFKSLFLINAPVYSGQLRKRPYDHLQKSAFGRIATLAMSKSKFKNRYKSKTGNSLVLDESFLDEMWKLNEANEGYTIHHKLKRMGAQFKKKSKSLRRSLKNSDIPVHLLFGEEDKYLSENSYIRYKNEFEGAGLTLMQGVGHFPHIESSAETARAIKEFTSQLVVKAV